MIFSAFLIVKDSHCFRMLLLLGMLGFGYESRLEKNIHPCHVPCSKFAFVYLQKASPRASLSPFAFSGMFLNFWIAWFLAKWNSDSVAQWNKSLYASKPPAPREFPSSLVKIFTPVFMIVNEFIIAESCFHLMSPSRNSWVGAIKVQSVGVVID